MSGKVFDFSIAGIRIQIRSDAELKVTEAFEDFLITQKETDKTQEKENLPQYVASFRAADRLQLPEGRCIYQDGRFLIYSTGEHSYQRVFRRDTDEREIYAVSVYEAQKNLIEITYLETERKLFTDTQKVFLHIGWEWILMREEKMMLHASCVNTPYGGLVFSGPSGIGKSTQAKLWCECEGAALINGDKTILAKTEDGWSGYGSPYAGSSGCYVNTDCQIRAVLFLKQAEACEIRRLNTAEAFKRIYTGLTVNHWDAAYVERVSAMALHMAMELPVYEYFCTPNQQAVEYLKETILGGDGFDE